MSEHNFEIKTISGQGVPRALEKAHRYRMLNEPEEAESICRDILEIDPDNQQALTTLLLALTDQLLDRGLGNRVREDTRFVLRELTCVPVALFALLMLGQLRSLARGPEAYVRILAHLESPLSLVLCSSAARAQGAQA